VNIDLLEATKRIQKFVQIVKNIRYNTEHQFNLVFKKTEEMAIRIGLELQLPKSP